MTHLFNTNCGSCTINQHPWMLNPRPSRVHQEILAQAGWPPATFLLRLLGPQFTSATYVLSLASTENTYVSTGVSQLSEACLMRTLRKSSSEPLNHLGSVSTERMLAPTLEYCKAWSLDMAACPSFCPLMLSV